MKVRVIQQGDETFTYHGEDEAALRQALLHGTGPGAHSIVYDLTDLDRSDMDADEYLIAAEDDGTPVWAGWLGGVTGPPPPDRDALAALAAKWETAAVETSREAAVMRGHAAEERQSRAHEARQHARELLAAIGQPS